MKWILQIASLGPNPELTRGLLEDQGYQFVKDVEGFPEARGEGYLTFDRWETLGTADDVWKDMSSYLLALRLPIVISTLLERQADGTVRDCCHRICVDFPVPVEHLQTIAADAHIPLGWTVVQKVVRAVIAEVEASGDPLRTAQELAGKDDTARRRFSEKVLHGLPAFGRDVAAILVADALARLVELAAESVAVYLGMHPGAQVSPQVISEHMEQNPVVIQIIQQINVTVSPPVAPEVEQGKSGPKPHSKSNKPPRGGGQKKSKRGHRT